MNGTRRDRRIRRRSLFCHPALAVRAADAIPIETITQAWVRALGTTRTDSLRSPRQNVRLCHRRTARLYDMANAARPALRRSCTKAGNMFHSRISHIIRHGASDSRTVCGDPLRRRRSEIRPARAVTRAAPPRASAPPPRGGNRSPSFTVNAQYRNGPPPMRSGDHAADPAFRQPPGKTSGCNLAGAPNMASTAGGNAGMPSRCASSDRSCCAEQFPA